jgi:Na+/H+ antiporter NhaD/arsenite permease-like protein
MLTTFSKWLVPAVGFVIGALMSLALIGRNAAPWQVALSFAIVAGYALALRFLQSRSETASLLSGMPADERWEAINQKSLSNAAQVMAVVLVVAFLWISFTGGDVLPYAWVGAVFAVAYLGSIAWYRIRN